VSGGTTTAGTPPTAKPRKGRRNKGFDRPRFLRVYVAFAYLFLFTPIFVVVLFSFNSIKSLQNFDGFSLQWYEEFWNDETLRESLFASLEIAVLSMVVGVVLGTMLAIGLVRSRARWSGSANILMLIPLVVPEIVAGISALLIFSQIGLQLSIFTVILAHITF
jgi:spermidine/putrescine transport system permease protein